MSWQPIETAPVNQLVLIWIPNSTNVSGDKGRYSLATLHAKLDPDMAAYSKSFPTHWQSLPEPPQDKVEDAA